MGKKMMKKAMRMGKIGKRRSVFSGKKEKTRGGLKKTDLKKNKNGKIVSKKGSARGHKAYKHIAKWVNAVKQARRVLGVKGMVVIGGKTPRGQALLAKARSIYKK